MLLAPTTALAQARLGAEVGAPFAFGARAEATLFSRVRLGALFLGFPEIAIRHFTGGEIGLVVVNADEGQVYVTGAIGRGYCTQTETRRCDRSDSRTVSSVLAGVEMSLGSRRRSTLGVEFGNWFDLAPNDVDDFSRRSMALIYRIRLK